MSAFDPKRASYRLLYGGPSLGLYICISNDATEFIILLAQEGSEINAAYSDRIKALGDKLRPYFGNLHCGGEPGRELGNRFLRRVRRREPFQKSISYPLS